MSIDTKKISEAIANYIPPVSIDYIINRFEDEDNPTAFSLRALYLECSRVLALPPPEKIDADLKNIAGIHFGLIKTHSRLYSWRHVSSFISWPRSYDERRLNKIFDQAQPKVPGIKPPTAGSWITQLVSTAFSFLDAKDPDTLLCEQQEILYWLVKEYVKIIDDLKQTIKDILQNENLIYNELIREYQRFIRNGDKEKDAAKYSLISVYKELYPQFFEDMFYSRVEKMLGLQDENIKTQVSEFCREFAKFATDRDHQEIVERIWQAILQYKKTFDGGSNDPKTLGKNKDIQVALESFIQSVPIECKGKVVLSEIFYRLFNEAIQQEVAKFVLSEDLSKSDSDIVFVEEIKKALEQILNLKNTGLEIRFKEEFEQIHPAKNTEQAASNTEQNDATSLHNTIAHQLLFFRLKTLAAELQGRTNKLVMNRIMDLCGKLVICPELGGLFVNHPKFNPMEREEPRFITRFLIKSIAKHTDYLNRIQAFYKSAQVMVDKMLAKNPNRFKQFRELQKRGVSWPHSDELRKAIVKAGFRFGPMMVARDRCVCDTCEFELHARSWYDPRECHDYSKHPVSFEAELYQNSASKSAFFRRIPQKPNHYVCDTCGVEASGLQFWVNPEGFHDYSKHILSRSKTWYHWAKIGLLASFVRGNSGHPFQYSILALINPIMELTYGYNAKAKARTKAEVTEDVSTHAHFTAAVEASSVAEVHTTAAVGMAAPPAPVLLSAALGVQTPPHEEPLPHEGPLPNFSASIMCRFK